MRVLVRWQDGPRNSARSIVLGSLEGPQRGSSGIIRQSLEGVFSEVGLPLYGILRSSPQKCSRTGSGKFLTLSLLRRHERVVQRGDLPPVASSNQDQA